RVKGLGRLHESDVAKAKILLGTHGSAHAIGAPFPIETIAIGIREGALQRCGVVTQAVARRPEIAEAAHGGGGKNVVGGVAARRRLRPATARGERETSG